jgi:hypothetical protein
VIEELLRVYGYNNIDFSKNWMLQFLSHLEMKIIKYRMWLPHNWILKVSMNDGKLINIILM